MSTDTPDAPDASVGTAASRYVAMQQSEDFARLRKALRSWVFPMTVAFFSWYALYVVLSAYARDFMTTQLFGTNINLGLIFGLLQFVSTFVITHLYVAHADKNTDPIADEMRNRLEHHEFAGGSAAGTAGEGATRA